MRYSRLALILIGTSALLAFVVSARAAGTAYADCSGSTTNIDCTGVDADGWDANVEAIGASTTVTVETGAQVQGPIRLDGDDTVTVEAGSSVDSGTWLTAVDGNGDNDQVTNNGTITATGEAQNFGLEGATVHNTASGTIDAHGIDEAAGMGWNTLGLSGDTVLVNDGAIDVSAGDIAAGIASYAGDPAHITNNGTIESTSDTLAVGIQCAVCTTSDVTNTGSIEASGPESATGIRTFGSASGEVTNSGTIEASGRLTLGVQVDAVTTAQITNDGTVTANGTDGGVGLSATNADVVQVTNNDTIETTGAFMSLGIRAEGDSSTDVINTGTITAESANLGNAVWATSTGTTTVTNGGTITTTGTTASIGLEVSGNTVQVTNDGTIAAPDPVGVGINVTGGEAQITNSGTITGGSTAIQQAAGASLDVTNSGTINGDVLLDDGDDSFTAEDGAVNGTLDGGADFDTLTFAFDVLDVDYPALAAQIAAASRQADR